MKSSVLHARFGTLEEFSETNQVIPAGIFCLELDPETGVTSAFKIGDGVTPYIDLASFEPFVQIGPVG